MSDFLAPILPADARGRSCPVQPPPQPERVLRVIDRLALALAAAGARIHATMRGVRPQMAPQDTENIDSAPGNGVTPDGGGRREGPALGPQMAPQLIENVDSCARPSWRDPAGGRPVRVRGSARPLASVASSPAMARAKRTQ